MEQPETLSPEASAPRKKSLFSGFWIRLLCMILDYHAILLFFYLLTFLLREHLFRISPFTEYVGGGITFLYFWLGNGPVGKGRTFGKVLFNLRVQDLEGRPPSLLVSFKRTVIQAVNPFFLPLVIQPFTTDPQIHHPLLFVGFLSFTLSFLVSNALLVALHPLKRGYHDILAGTVVARGGGPVSFEQIEAARSGRLLGRKVRTPATALQTAGIAFILIFSIQLWNGYQQSRSEQWKYSVNLYREMKARFSLEGFDLSDLRLVMLPPDKEKGEAEKEAGEKKETAPRDSSSTDTLSAGERKYRFYVIYTTSRDVTEKDIRDNAAIEEMLPELGECVEEKLATAYKTRIERGHIPRDMKVAFIERLNLFLYFHEKTEAEFIVPLDTQKLDEMYREAKENNP